ncbi:MAG: hypothetical protein K0R71_2086 [Bacillales bacterium]|jgi:hypothetical protein|nr:hypothetical protein [Bacillales bacterium]
MKKYTSIDYLGYLYVIIASLNYFGPKIGGKIVSFVIVFIAFFLAYGNHKRKQIKNDPVEKKQATLSAASVRRMKKR